jgi:hypothetical protein
MEQTYYNSAEAGKIPTLAEASWQVFSPFLSRYQWAFDDPSHSPRVQEIESAIRNKGRKGSNTFMREGSWKYILRPLQSWAFEKAIANGRKIYYVSYGAQALLYFDIDLHYAWQTQEEGQKARQLLDEIFPQQLFWSQSSRGLNGYLKVDLQRRDYENANSIIDDLEKALQLYLASNKNLADFEIKGRISYFQAGKFFWKQYGKLPIHTPGWNFPRLQEFKSKPAVGLQGLGALCNQIKASIPQEVLQRHRDYKKLLGVAPHFENRFFFVTPVIEKALVEKYGEDWRYRFMDWREREDGIWLADYYYRPGQIPVTEKELREEEQNHVHEKQTQTSQALSGLVAAADQANKEHASRTNAKDHGMVQPAPSWIKPSAHQRSQFNLDLCDLRTEPDSLKRQREALFRLARYLKRVPTLDESLRLFKEERLFTGTWSENENRRKARTAGTLAFIAETFDISQCANDSVNVGKYEAWAKQRFPNGIRGRNRRNMTEDGQVVEIEHGVPVSPEFIAIFLAVCEFALLLDKNKDKTLPHRRAEEVWNALFARGVVAVRFCSRKWAVCREEMVRYGIVQITDRNYGPNKAMEWALGNFFPFLGLWKTPKRPGLLEPEVFTRKKNTTTRTHNTLLRKQSLDLPVITPSGLSRPPPGSKSVSL